MDLQLGSGTREKKVERRGVAGKRGGGPRFAAESSSEAEALRRRSCGAGAVARGLSMRSEDARWKRRGWAPNGILLAENGGKRKAILD